MRDRIVPNSALLTTGDLARLFERTPRGARWIADQENLACERLRNGRLLFRPGDVQRLAERRLEQRLKRVTNLRPKMLWVRGEPRQISLWGPRAALPKGEVLRARLPGNQGASDNVRNVNKRGARCRRKS